MSEEPLIAVFVDFENLAIGVRDMKVGQFQIQLVLKRLLEKGRLVYKRAYCDWSNYQDAVREFHTHGIELIDIPQSKASGKNSADIRMVVDALDLCYSKQHIDVFALISGDSDFSPLVSKLKENDKRVIGCGAKSSTSDLLIANCDEFIYYDDLIRAAKKTRVVAKKGKTKVDKKQEAIERVMEVAASAEQDYDPLWGSTLKQAIRRVHPGFNEGYYGYGSFSELLEDLKAKGLIELEYDDSRGNYKVRRKKG
ncbi:MAG: NYN domain-containing protein [Pirellulales bacterium]|nr:NYN domain-containing protein [Pirellulales bacterium]